MLGRGGEVYAPSKVGRGGWRRGKASNKHKKRGGGGDKEGELSLGKSIAWPNCDGLLGKKLKLNRMGVSLHYQNL